MFNLFKPNNCRNFEGKLKNPTTSSCIIGSCGDDMEFHLLIEDYIVKDVTFFTEKGCQNTKTAGNAVCARILGKNLINTLKVNPGTIIQHEKSLQSGGQHCAILATMALYQAITNFLLNQN